MASTNKTTHYELDQYVSTDKPTYLTDYNGDMLKIDNGIYNAQQKADSAYTLAGTADGKADNAQLTANTAVTNAGTANTNIGTMANLETTNKTSLVGAINENVRNINNFNLTVFETATNITPSFGTVSSVSNTFSIAKNSDGSLAKIYGAVQITDVSGGGTRELTVTGQTSLRPTSDILINCAGLVREFDANGDIAQLRDQAITLKTTGEIELKVNVFNDTASVRFMLWPCLYFVKDFGDAPISSN